MPKRINQAWLTEDGKVPVEGNFTLGDITLDTSSLATSVNQDETNTTLSTIETKIPTGLTVTDNALIVDGSAFTQTVTGTVTANTGLTQPLTEAEFLAALPIGVTGTFWQETQPVSMSALPTDAATASNQSAQITSLQLMDDVVATNGSTAVAKLNQVGGIDPYGLAQTLAVTGGGELLVAQLGGATDMFGTQRIGAQYPQIDVQFYRATSGTLSELVNVVAPTGTGYASIVDGGLVIGTGTGANGSQKVTSYTTTTYRSGSEEYCYFTLTTTSTTNVNSFQRVLFGDTDNGFAVGFNGTTFGILSRYKTVDTHVTQANFNLDPLDGSPSSKFTRAGVPEAINPTRTNVFRIRFGWVGSAPDLFEVMNPDGRWVAFHILRHPNLYTRASLTNADLPITAEVSKSSGDNVDLKLTCYCWGAGVTGDPLSKGLTATSLTVTGTVQTVRNSGGWLYGYQILNPGNNTAYVQFFETAGTVTLGTTTPKFSIGNGTLDNIGVMFPAPIPFSGAIKIAATTTATGATNPNQPQNVTLFYQ